MKFIEKKIRARTIGIILLILNLPIFALGVIAVLFMFGSIIEYGAEGMFPGTILAIVLFFSTFLFFKPAFRYLRNKPFKQNKILGWIIISLGILNLGYKLITFFGGVWGDAPGRVLIAGFFSVYAMVFGMAFLFDFSKDKNKS